MYPADLVEQPHLQADGEIAVEQRTDADHDDGDVREDVAELGDRAALGGISVAPSVSRVTYL